MSRYAFVSGFYNDIFVVKAKTKRLAIKKFIEAIKGRFGFADDYRPVDFVHDIEFGMVTITKIQELGVG